MAKWRSKVSETIMRTEAHMETCAITSARGFTVERWSGKVLLQSRLKFEFGAHGSADLQGGKTSTKQSYRKVSIWELESQE